MVQYSSRAFRGLSETYVTLHVNKVQLSNDGVKVASAIESISVGLKRIILYCTLENIAECFLLNCLRRLLKPNVVINIIFTKKHFVICLYYIIRWKLL